MKKKQFGIVAVVVVLLLIFMFFGAIIGFISDYLWFREMGYVSVFFKQLFTQLKLGIPTLVVITGLTYLYLNALKKGYYKKVEVADAPGASEKVVRRFTLVLSAGFGVLATLSTVTKLWFQILQFSNATDFGVADPIFNNDVGFYMFKLEFLSQLNQIGLTIVGAFFLITVLYYMLLMSFRHPQIFEPASEPEYETEQDGGPRFGGNFSQFGPFGEMFENAAGGFGGRRPGRQTKQFDRSNFGQLLTIASTQISVMGVVFFLMVAANFYIKQFGLLYSSTGLLYGAGYTDINVTLLIYRVLMGLALLAAVFFVVGVKKKKVKTALVVPVIMIVLSIGGTGIAAVVQNVVVSPDEINKESEYLMNNITYTQMAYDLQDISIKDFPAQNTLTKDDILNNMGTFSNIRINDFEPAAQFYNQTQSIRSYYTFHDVDVDRYMINGEYTQTFLSAREIDESKIGDQWLTKHLKYTHGYGITLSRVDKVTASGQPDMLIDSIPPVSDVEEIQIQRPEIYFGEKTNNYIVVNTDEQEFDYPSGESNAYNTYEGTAGINMNLFNRMVFAIREQSLKLLVSSNIDSNSRIIINRNVSERVKKIAPFLSYDEPYIVTVDGKLYWMLDAYTTSPYFPYSEPYNTEQSYDNYIRNSVKVVVDAYNGDVDFYLVDDDDPVAMTLAKIYPQLFKNFDAMPEALRAHVRYPNYLFNIQANVYKKYHMNDVRVFYQKEDLWAIAMQTYGQESKVMTPQYYITKLPGEQDVEFINSIPYTPNNKNNMTGLLVARNDNGHYGELVLFRLPKDRIIYGPQQVEAQINQDTNISKEFSLWNNSGSNYSRGDMFVIPVEQSLVYVEPVYLEAANGSLPEVKRVIVAYGDKIAYESTLAQALNKLFGAGAGDPLSSSTPAADGENSSGTEGGGQSSDVMTMEQMAQLANEAFENAVEAQQKGDWSGYGEYLNELQKYLTLMQPAGSGEAADQGGNALDAGGADAGNGQDAGEAQ